MTTPVRSTPVLPARRWPALALAVGSLLFVTPACAASKPPSTPAKAHGAAPHGAPPKAPARGHYARLAARSPEPAPGAEKLDALKFVHEPEHIQRTLSRKPVYLQVDPKSFRLPPRPANSSAQTRAELDYMLRLQAQRTPEEVHRNLYWADWGYSTSAKPGDRDYELLRGNLFLVGRSVGTWFNPESLPLTAELLHRLWADLRYYVWNLKYEHARVRPYVLEPKLKNLQETNWAAFPSAHSSYAYTLAYLYSELAPEFSDVFTKDALEIAHSREILGVHYPSDSEAGRTFARQFVDLLLADEKFQRDLAPVREEWRRVREQTE